MFLQAGRDEAAMAALQGGAAEWLWLIPVLPLLGFVLNGALSLIAATHLGPADPAAGHHTANEGAHDTTAGGHTDDHHPARHRFAGLTSFVGPAAPEHAQALYARFCEHLRAHGAPVARGEFAAHMAVRLVNDGPVTIWLDSATLPGRNA